MHFCILGEGVSVGCNLQHHLPLSPTWWTFKGSAQMFFWFGVVYIEEDTEGNVEVEKAFNFYFDCPLICLLFSRLISCLFCKMSENSEKCQCFPNPKMTASNILFIHSPKIFRLLPWRSKTRKRPHLRSCNQRIYSFFGPSVNNCSNRLQLIF